MSKSDFVGFVSYFFVTLISLFCTIQFFILNRLLDSFFILLVGILMFVMALLYLNDYYKEK